MSFWTIPPVAVFYLWNWTEGGTFSEERKIKSTSCSCWELKQYSSQNENSSSPRKWELGWPRNPINFWVRVPISQRMLSYQTTMAEYHSSVPVCDIVIKCSSLAYNTKFLEILVHSVLLMILWSYFASFVFLHIWIPSGWMNHSSIDSSILIQWVSLFPLDAYVLESNPRGS